MEDAAKYGDGFRSPLPSDIIFINLVCWEIVVILVFIDFVTSGINKLVKKKYNIKW